MRRTPIVFLLAAGLTSACGPVTVRPASFPNPDVSCPGGRLSWTLEIEDQRANPEAQPRVAATVRDALQKSFPGCRWNAPPDPDAGTIRIEVHRFAAVFDTGSWEAAVDWTVSARDPRGHTLTEFQATEEVSRPNYQGSDNEKEALSEAFRKAIERTARGLTAVSVSEGLRPREGTIGASLAPASRDRFSSSTR